MESPLAGDLFANAAAKNDFMHERSTLITPITRSAFNEHQWLARAWRSDSVISYANKL